MHDTFPSRRWLFVLFALSTAIWFSTLEYRKLIKPDEGRYAEIAREMYVTGDWVTPRLNGIKYFEKPPLQYWMTAAAFEAFGENEWTARLWPALTGFGGLLLTFLVGRALFGRETALLSVSILGSSMIYVVIGHLNTLDMGLAFFMHLALCGFLMANRPEVGRGESRRWMLVTWAALALGVLTKGMVAPVLAGATLIAYSLLARDFSPWRRLELARGLPLFLLIAAPWFIAVSIANPEFPRFFFIHEHVERFLTKVHHRYQPWWYFIPIFALGAVPWTLTALHALAAAWRDPERSAFRLRLFLGLWVVIVFGFFSVSDSKLPSYILPLYPALAWLTADAARRWSRGTLLAHLGVVALAAAAAIAVLPGITRYADEETTHAMIAAYGRWLIWGAAIWFGGSLGALLLTWKGRAQPALLCLAMAAFLANTIFLQGHEELGRSNSSYYIARLVKPMLSPGVPFYSVAMYEQTLPFYLQRTVTLVDYTDEMKFGLEQEPSKWIPTVEAFEARWRSEADAFAVMRKDTYREIRRHGLPMEIVAEDTRRIIVRRQPHP
jgi:4-amino-4-deoxy-L-arabinose transferase-like glycosyltransferase